MERALIAASLDDVRACIARALLDAAEAPERTGDVTLRPHQREAVRRIRATMTEHGGALLADEVGLGKTYVATALIAESPAPLIICPASLRGMWQSALDAAGTRSPIVTYSALSRGQVPDAPATLLVLDEAHHARTPGTRRYAAIARLAAAARVVALSATPIHNSRGDLAAVLALFLGARAWRMTDEELARCVVRREHADLPDEILPALSEPRRLETGDDGTLLRAIMELPPPVPPRRGGDGGALVAWGLVRQWASSRAALDGALRRRLARAVALRAALGEGRYPTARELSAWTAAEDSVQLAFPSLVAAEHGDSAELAAALDRHADALRSLAGATRADTGPDDRRATLLRELRTAHSGERIVAFSQYADTAQALYRRLAPGGGVGVLTGRGARVAGGVLSRRELLARFAPRGQGRGEPHARDRVDLLLATDLLSEGLDLGEASVVVHLDLPWTPARLEQRVGRSRRLGARHARTVVYTFAPPVEAEELLAIERRLRAKLGAAARATGIMGSLLPSMEAPKPVEPAAARQREIMHRIISTWRRDRVPVRTGSGPLIAGGRGECGALIVLARERGRAVLAGACGSGALSEDPACVVAALERVRTALPGDVDDEGTARARRAIEHWSERATSERAAGGGSVFRAPARRAALQRISSITARTMHHRRPLIAPLAATARRVVTTPFGVGAELILDALAGAPLADEAWLRALKEFGAIHARDLEEGSEEAGAVEIMAVIVVTEGGGGVPG